MTAAVLSRDLQLCQNSETSHLHQRRIFHPAPHSLAKSTSTSDKGFRFCRRVLPSPREVSASAKDSLRSLTIPVDSLMMIPDAWPVSRRGLSIDLLSRPVTTLHIADGRRGELLIVGELRQPRAVTGSRSMDDTAAATRPGPFPARGHRSRADNRSR